MGDGDAVEQRRRQRAEKARELRAAQAVAAGREPGQRGRPSNAAGEEGQGALWYSEPRSELVPTT